MEKCALYDIEEILQDSHIIPELFYNYLKSDVGNHPFYTKGRKPMQDGYKIPLLCHDAEVLFSKYEGYFASHIFRPLLYDNKDKVEYDGTLFKFTVSLIWRALLDFKQTVEGDKSITPQNSMVFTKPILDNWKYYLLGKNKTPTGSFYIIPISEKWLDENGIPRKYHRCFLCDMDWNFHCINEKVMFYVVAPGFLFLVDLFSEDDENTPFISHKLYDSEGVLSKEIMLVPELLELLLFIGEKGINAIDKVFINKEKVQSKLEKSKKYSESNIRRIYLKALN